MPDALTLLDRFSADANRFDFFQAVRLVECAHPGLPRVGSSLRPREDAVRFGQEPELIFFPTTLRHFTATGESAPKLVVNFLGLNWGLKQAQWTSLVLFVVLLPLTYLVLKYSKPVPEGEVAATYGIPQRKKQDEEEQQDQDAQSEAAGATEGTGGEVAEVQEATGDVEARGV